MCIIIHTHMIARSLFFTCKVKIYVFIVYMSQCVHTRSSTSFCANVSCITSHEILPNLGLASPF